MVNYVVNSNPGDLAEERQGMQSALGLAISNWARIENGLSSVFAVAVSANSMASANAAFTAIASFEAQLAMVDASMKVTFEEKTGQNSEILAGWSVLKKRVSNLRSRRNKLAHGQIVSISIGGQKPKMFFLPYFFIGTHKDHRKFDHMTETNIIELANLISRLADEIVKFGWWLQFGRKMNEPCPLPNRS